MDRACGITHDLSLEHDQTGQPSQRCWDSPNIGLSVLRPNLVVTQDVLIFLPN